MIEDIRNTERSVAITNRPLILYAAGLMGGSVKEFLNNNGAEVDCFIDRNKDVSGLFKSGIPVYLPEEVSFEKRKISLVLISFVKCSYEEISAYLKNLGYENVMFAGDFCGELVSGQEIANIWWAKKTNTLESKKIANNCNSFYDYESVKEYKQALDWFSKHDKCKDAGFTVNKEDRYFIHEVKEKLKLNGVFIDSAYLGGEYVEKIKAITRDKFEKIFSFLLAPEDNPIIEDDRIKVLNMELGDKNEEDKVIRVGLMNQYVSMLPLT